MRKRIFISLLFFSLSVVILAQIFVILKYLEGEIYTFFDGIYWVITTVTTVGFGDIVFNSTIGRIYTIFVMLYGIAFIFGFFFPYVVIPFAEKRLLFKLPEESSLKDHVIICGINRISKIVYSDLKKNKRNCLLMDDDEDKVREALEEGLTAVLSDYSLESFKRNNIDKALAIVLFEEAEKNLDILLTLQDYELDKYAVLNLPEYAKYLLMAGAKKVFLPKSVAGSQLAKFVSENIRGTVEAREIVKGYGVAEICVSEFSKIRGESVNRIERNFDIKIVAVLKGGRVHFSPEKSLKVDVGDTIQVFGKMENIQRLFEEARGYF